MKRNASSAQLRTAAPSAVAANAEFPNAIHRAFIEKLSINAGCLPYNDRITTGYRPDSDRIIFRANSRLTRVISETYDFFLPQPAQEKFNSQIRCPSPRSLSIPCAPTNTRSADSPVRRQRRAFPVHFRPHLSPSSRRNSPCGNLLSSQIAEERRDAIVRYADCRKGRKRRD
jgi:hypothetical protein